MPHLSFRPQPAVPRTVLPTVIMLVLLAVAACAWPSLRAASAADDAPPSAPEAGSRIDDKGATPPLQVRQSKESQAAAEAPDKSGDKAGDKPLPAAKETRRRIVAGGKALDYLATTGVLRLRDDEDKPKADVYFTAYTLQGAEPSRRPVTFAFNGGPGSSSVWLHLGALGPRRLVLAGKGEAPPPPVRLTDNEHSWLAFTDLVFIDPVGTGYSRAASRDKARDFYSYQNDIEAVGDFIRLWLTRGNRWLSPLFLAGESYGTTRAAGLAGYLHDTHGIDLNGIVLVSPVLDFETITLGQATDLAYALALPTYAAAARYHGRLGPEAVSPEKAAEEAWQWAAGIYTQALLRGTALGAGERAEVVRSYAALTGLSERYVDLSDLRVIDFRFRKELLRDQRLVIGRMDARMASPDSDAVSDSTGLDPLFDTLIGPFSMAINHYLRAELGFEQDLPYRYLNYEANRAWDYSSAIPGRQGYVRVSDTLARAMLKNRYLKVMVVSGLYDLATPYAAARYTIDHLDLPPGLKANISHRVYPSGHMPYVDPGVIAALAVDAREFYAQAAAEAGGGR